MSGGQNNKIVKEELREFLKQYYIGTYWLDEMLKAKKERKYDLEDIFYENLYGFMWGLRETGIINEKKREALSEELRDMYRAAEDDGLPDE